MIKLSNLDMMNFEDLKLISYILKEVYSLKENLKGIKMDTLDLLSYLNDYEMKLYEEMLNHYEKRLDALDNVGDPANLARDLTRIYAKKWKQREMLDNNEIFNALVNFESKYNKLYSYMYIYENKFKYTEITYKEPALNNWDCFKRENPDIKISKELYLYLNEVLEIEVEFRDGFQIKFEEGFYEMLINDVNVINYVRLNKGREDKIEALKYLIQQYTLAVGLYEVILGIRVCEDRIEVLMVAGEEYNPLLDINQDYFTYEQYVSTAISKTIIFLVMYEVILLNPDYIFKV